MTIHFSLLYGLGTREEGVAHELVLTQIISAVIHWSNLVQRIWESSGEKQRRGEWTGEPKIRIIKGSKLDGSAKSEGEVAIALK